MLKYLNNFEAKQIMNISILWQLLEANHLTFERKEKHEHLSMQCLLLQLIWRPTNALTIIGFPKKRN
jgi:hypothetical protein